MRIFDVLKRKSYFAVAAVSAILMLIVFPLIQVQASGGLQNIDLWFKVIPIQNLTLVIIFSIIFGAFLAFQIYNLKSKVCSIENKAASAAGGGLASLLGILVPACPACISIITLLLPASLGISIASIFIKYSTILLSTSILLLLLGIYLLGGFKKS